MKIIACFPSLGLRNSPYTADGVPKDGSYGSFRELGNRKRTRHFAFYGPGKQAINCPGTFRSPGSRLGGLSGIRGGPGSNLGTGSGKPVSNTGYKTGAHCSRSWSRTAQPHANKGACGSAAACPCSSRSRPDVLTGRRAGPWYGRGFHRGSGWERVHRAYDARAGRQNLPGGRGTCDPGRGHQYKDGPRAGGLYPVREGFLDPTGPSSRRLPARCCR